MNSCFSTLFYKFTVYSQTIMEYTQIARIKEHPDNPRVIKDEAFQKLVQSIKGFPEMLEKRPLVCVTGTDGKLWPLGGNKRYKAAKAAGMDAVPVVMADEWNEDQRREFMVKDNVVSGGWDFEELKNWDVDLLADWGVDIPDDTLMNKNIDPFKPRPTIHKKGEFYYISLFRAREKKGVSLEEFKKNQSNVHIISDYAATFANIFFQTEAVIITTPKRSHFKKNGFHFATECCKVMAATTGLPFMEDVFTAKDFNKISPVITMNVEIESKNIILVDDIITTGSTLIACRELLPGKNVFPLIMITNN